RVWIWHLRICSCLTRQAVSQQRLQIRRHSPIVFQIKIFLNKLSRILLAAFDSPDHQVLVCMFGRNELNNIGFVAHDAEDKRTKGIRENIAHALLQNAVAENRLEQFHSLQLLLKLVMATGSTENQARLPAN